MNYFTINMFFTFKLYVWSMFHKYLKALFDESIYILHTDNMFIELGKNKEGGEGPGSRAERMHPRLIDEFHLHFALISPKFALIKDF